VRSDDRLQGWLIDLGRTLQEAENLVRRGRDAYNSDSALPLAFEALCARVGDLAKKIAAAAPDEFRDPIWKQAARTRDFVVHHYSRVDQDALWNTVSSSFPLLAEQLRRGREN
jgi:uncharacterized protein with HEPN domain